MLTLGNIFSGFSAIVYASNGNYVLAAIFILAAAIFDMFDGITARLINATSELGAELDSLCDLVSFGVAPSFILYKTFFHTYGEIGILFASLPALTGAIRLARFNTQLDVDEDKLHFVGMPIPSGALTLVPYIVFVHDKGIIPAEWQGFVVFAATILVSVSMVSTIYFANAPRPTISDLKARPFTALGFLIAIIASAVTLGKAIFFVMMGYILISYTSAIVRRIKTHRTVEDEMDEDIL
jgi:CDP-diacylglycerol--serine O-phosphatidyltransferase